METNCLQCSSRERHYPKRVNAIFEQSDSSVDDDEELAGIAEGLTLVDISDDSMRNLMISMMNKVL